MTNGIHAGRTAATVADCAASSSAAAVAVGGCRCWGGASWLQRQRGSAHGPSIAFVIYLSYRSIDSGTAECVCGVGRAKILAAVSRVTFAAVPALCCRLAAHDPPSTDSVGRSRTELTPPAARGATGTHVIPEPELEGRDMSFEYVEWVGRSAARIASCDLSAADVAPGPSLAWSWLALSSPPCGRAREVHGTAG